MTRHDATAAAHVVQMPPVVAPEHVIGFALEGETVMLGVHERGTRCRMLAFPRSSIAELARKCGYVVEDGAKPKAPALRSEVLAFALVMERKLRENDHKGGWGNDHPIDLLQRAREELTELRRVVAKAFPGGGGAGDVVREIEDEAADVANFAMMIADTCGGLK